MGEISISLQQLVGSNQLKKDRFAEIINQELSYSNADKANLFIDFNSCVKKLYSPLFNLASIREESELAGAIINIVIYYRKLFRIMYSVSVDTYIVISNNCGTINRMYVPSYNQAKYNALRTNRQLQGFVNKNIQILKMITPYLQNTTIFDTDYETAVGVKYIIDHKLRDGMENVPNIVISSDLIMTELIGGVNKKVVIIHPKKEAGQDISYSISDGRSIANLMFLRKSNKTSTILTDSWLPFLLASSKCPERGIKAVCPLDMIIDGLEESIQLGLIQNSYPPRGMDIIGKLNQSCYKRLIGCNFDSRYKALDIIYQSKMYESAPERLSAFMPIQNLYSPKAIQEISMKYFTVSPLDLNNI